MGTFTKAFGGFGGFLAGSQALIDYLRMTARSYIFTAPIPPAVCAGLIASLRLAADNGLRDRLRENTKRFRDGATALGKINTAGGIDAPASTFGDLGVTNYAAFAADGTLTLEGTARVTRCVVFANSDLSQGNTSPDRTDLGNFLGYSYDINDDAGYVWFV